MTSIRYEASDQTREADNPSFLLADHGSSIFLGTHRNTSAWQGISFLDLTNYEMTKAVHALVPEHEPESLTIESGRATRTSDAFREQFFMHDRLACYRAEGSGDVAVEVDVRCIDDFSEFGREHEATVLSTDPTVVRIRNGQRSFLIISSAPITLRNSWHEKQTPFDARRGGRESWWVQRRAVIHVKQSARVVFCPERRRREAQQVLRAAHLWSRHYTRSGDPALLHAQESLDGLITRTPNGEASILAGLPWFFQIYTRDEAISTGGLLAQGKHHLAGRILLREVTTILHDGLIPNRFPHSETGSADGVGWAFLRLRELFWRSREALRDEQWSFVHSQLCTSLDRLRAHRVRDGFVHNQAQETWMDTTGRFTDDRSGARIEIQALTLNMIRFAAELCEYFGESSEEYRSWQEGLSSSVRDAFFDEQRDVLADGLDDFTVRPNVFIAFYAYDELLSDTQWKAVFEHAIDVLETPWGGLASIDPADDLYHPLHSGADDASYHRGDSWFFLNNLAAVCALRVSNDLRPFAQRVHDASREELLWRGACGHAAEISSSERFESLGCLSQAWSASSFIELSLALKK